MVDVDVHENGSMIRIDHTVVMEGAAGADIVTYDLGCEEVINSSPFFASWDFRVGPVLSDKGVFKIETIHQVQEVFVIGGVPKPRVNVASEYDGVFRVSVEELGKV
jgi:hypothetical protein